MGTVVLPVKRAFITGKWSKLAEMYLMPMIPQNPRKFVIPLINLHHFIGIVISYITFETEDFHLLAFITSH